MSVTSTDVLLLIDKPPGVTSHDVVALARRSLGIRRIGHAGTLDPFATGLLILLAGKGTRLIQFVPTDPKIYLATIRFGLATDTDDFTGAPIGDAPLPDPARFADAFRTLSGDIAQLPPRYSAKHVGGKRAYTVARQGDAPALSPATVTVFEWQLLAKRPDEIDVRIACGSGTYIRALARDLGQLLDSAAHLSALRRTNAGPFAVDEADSWDSLRQGVVRRRTLTSALVGCPTQVLSEEDVRRVSRGMRVEATSPESERAMLTDERGTLLAVAQRAGTSWQPQVVLVDA